MAESTSKRRSSQPIAPQVPAETWKALVAAADEFNRLAPWEWMHDSHVVGLRHPVTKEVLLASVLGRMGQVFALLVYRRDTGHRWLLNTILNDGDSGGLDGEEAAFEQDLMKAEFVLKRELVKEDQAVLAESGYTPANKRGHVWPQFRSMVPGGFPWHLTHAEAEALLFALPRVAAVARLMQTQPHVWEDHCHGDIGFVPDTYDPAAGDLRAEQMDWQSMIPPPETLPEEVSFTDPVVAKLSKLTQAKGFHLELDVAYAGFPIADAERPRFPKLAMAVDRASGFVGGFHLGDFKDRDGAGALGEVLRNALTRLGHRPMMIHVQRARVASMLTKVATQLGIAVVQDDELSELNFARQSMERLLNRGR